MIPCKPRSRRSHFAIDALETRRLLSTYYAYVQVTTPLETGSSNAIQVLDGQPVTFNVSVEGYMIGGGAGPTPTGTVNIYEYSPAFSYSQEVQVNLSGGTVTSAGTTATAQGTLHVSGDSNPTSGYQEFVYAEYQGDENYDDTTSSGSPPTDDGNVGNTVALNFPTMQYVFTQQPSDVAANTAMKPPVQVSYEDPSGAVDTYYNGSIYIVPQTKPSGAANSQFVATAVNGVATFSNVTFSTPGTYTLVASAPTYETTPVSSSFVVGAGDTLSFLQQPGTTDPGKTIQPPVTVEFQNSTGMPDTSASGTVTLSLSSASQLNTSTGTLGGTTTEPLVGGIATFSDLTVSKAGTYVLDADTTAGSSTTTSNKFKIGSSTLQVEINVKAPGGSKGVKTGDIILYSVVEKPKKTVQSGQLVVTLPTGFTPGGISGGGTFSGNTITWNTNTRVYNFDLVVPNGTILNGIKNITVSADDNVVYTDSSTDEGTATNVVKLASSFEVDGIVHDAVFDFPKSTAVSFSSPLAGVTVNLIDSTGAVVDSVVTTGNGKFSVASKQSGTFTLQLVSNAHMYSTALNQVQNATPIYIGQKVTIPTSNTTPVDLGTLVVPRTFLNNAADILQSMNNYMTSGFQSLAAFNINLFQFNTTGAEDVLNELAGAPANPTAPMDPAALKPLGPSDPWVGAIRMMAGLSEVDARFRDAFKLVDLSGKALAVTLSVSFVKKLGQLSSSITQKYPGLASWAGQGFVTQSAASQALSQGTRVALFTTLGATISTAFDKAASFLGVSSSLKGPTIGAIFTSLRYGYDILTGEKLVDDLGFEAVFNLIRLAFDTALLTGLTGVTVRSDVGAAYTSVLVVPALTGAIATGVTPTMQDQINDCVNNQASYAPADDTNVDLAALKGYDAAAHKRALKALSIESALNSVSSIIRGGDGAAYLFNKAGGIYSSGLLGSGQRLLQNTMASAEANLKAVLGIGAKALSSEILIPTLAAGAVGLLDQLSTTQSVAGIVGLAGAGGTAVLTAPIPVDPPSPAPVQAQNASVEAESTTTAATVSASATSDSAAYLADLTQLSSLVKTGNTAGITTLYPQWVADQQSLFGNDLVVLDQQATALESQLSQQVALKIGAFDEQLNYALGSVVYASDQLDAWGFNPATGNAAQVITQFNLTIAAVKAAVSQAAFVRQAIAGRSVPATLSIAETSVPSNPTAGSTQTFTFTVTNIGLEATSTGTLSFTNDDGGLTVQGDAQQPLPALVPGASATISFSVAVSTPSNGDTSPSFQIVAQAGSQSAELDDNVTLG